MPENLSLGSAQFARMLNVLLAEQAALKRRFRWYRLQRMAFYVLVVALAIAIVGTTTDFLYLFETGAVVAAIAYLATIPLFFLNLPFAWKLLKQARLRRQLGLQESLRGRLKAVTKKRWLMLLLSVVALGAVAGAVAQIVSTVKFQERTLLAEVFADVWLPASVIIVGLSVPSLWLISRGVDRLQELSRLRDRLAHEAGPEGVQPKSFEVSAGDYDHVARIEKMKTLEDRHRSVRQGAKLAKASIYAVQRSVEAQEAIERLDAKTRLRVEETIFELMGKPRPKAIREASPGRLSLPVPDSPLELGYEVDDENERIRIYSVQAVGDGQAGSEA